MKTAGIDAAFEKCVIKSKCINGDRYKCVKGLWEVNGNDSFFLGDRLFITLCNTISTANTTTC